MQISFQKPPSALQRQGDVRVHTSRSSIHYTELVSPRQHGAFLFLFKAVNDAVLQNSSRFIIWLLRLSASHYFYWKKGQWPVATRRLPKHSTQVVDLFPWSIGMRKAMCWKTFICIAPHNEDVHWTDVIHKAEVQEPRGCVCLRDNGLSCSLSSHRVEQNGISKW